MLLSIVSPVYLAEKMVDELVNRIHENLSPLNIDFEIILVDDGSPDDSWNKILELAKTRPFVKGIRLSRNFGQHYAITAGLSRVNGDVIVLMDCDLQDDPVYIQDLLKEKDKGYDIVFTKRIKRKHGPIKTFNSWVFNKLFIVFSERKYELDAGSLVLFTSQVKEEFLKLKDKDRLYLQMLKWLGYETSTISVEHKPRFEGESSYSFFKLVKLAVQGWTSHSDKLLRLSIYTGMGLSLVSFFFGLVITIRYFLGELQPGWPSIITTILFSTGLILLSIGVAGIYIAKIFDQVKERQLFIISEEINIVK